jgi:CHASE2 domain-containing sensor protein
MFNYLFKKDTLLATIAVFLVMGLLSLLPINTHVLDPIKFALQDFDYNDLAYSRMGKNKETPIDTNIVIVNIGDAGRQEIAAMIRKVDEQQPKVIGVDVLFNEPKGNTEDSLLLTQIIQNPKVVLAYNLQSNGEQISHEGFLYGQAKNKGFANFVGEERGVIRHFAPTIANESNNYSFFAASIAKVVDPKVYQELVNRNHDIEIINYTHTPEKFVVVNGRELLNGAVSGVSLANKVVLLGFVSSEEGSVLDKHFTPMNKNSFGKALPDMEGVFVHANIVRMILDRDYIRKVPAWITWALAFLLCWLHMSLFIKYYLERHLWFHLVAKTAQLLSAILFVYLALSFFYKFDTKVNLTPSLVAIILAVDVLYFYEAFCTWLNKKYHYKSVFAHAKHH